MGVRLFGTGWWEYTVGGQVGSFVCRNEGDGRRYRLRRAYRWLTLAWVPVVPVARLATWVECASCRAAHGIDVGRSPDAGRGRRLSLEETTRRDQSRIAVVPAGVAAFLAFAFGVPLIGLLLALLAAYFAYMGFMAHSDAGLDANAPPLVVKSRPGPEPLAKERRSAKVSREGARVLHALAEAGEATTAELAAALGYTAPVVAAVLDGLARAGLVAEHAGDRYTATPVARDERHGAEPTLLSGLAGNPVARRVHAAFEAVGPADVDRVSGIVGYAPAVVAHLADELVRAGRLQRGPDGKYRAVPSG